MLLLVLAFLVFYLLIATSNLLNGASENRAAARNQHLTYTTGLADQSAKSLENAITWVNNGLAEGASPAQAARLIRMSPEIEAATIVTTGGKILAAYPAGAQNLSSIDIAGIADNSVKITSIIGQDNKTVIPVIAKRSGNVVAIAGVQAGALIDPGLYNGVNQFAILAPSGQIISSNETLLKQGALNTFNVSKETLNQITAAIPGIVRGHKIDNKNYSLAGAQIKNTNLSFVAAKPEAKLSGFNSNLVLFTILFLGTCLLVGLLLRTVFRQVQSLREIQKGNEISQQRFQAAIEGERGGVWEIDLANNEAFIGASFASVLGMPRRETTVSLSNFLGLFHPQDREALVSTARRSHIQGEFDLDMRVAHLPIILQCRGNASTRHQALSTNLMHSTPKKTSKKPLYPCPPPQNLPLSAQEIGTLHKQPPIFGRVPHGYSSIHNKVKYIYYG